MAKSSLLSLLGFVTASVFSLAYLIAPLYIIASLLFFAIRPSFNSFVFALPLIISAVLPPVQSPWLLQHPLLRSMLTYFDFEEIFEVPDDEFLSQIDDLKKKNRSFILCGQPHGVLSYGGLCAGLNMDARYCKLKTAVAGAVLSTPIVKHLIGIFGLIDASAASLKKRLARGGLEGGVVLYSGGIAELFKCSDTEEILYLKNRKGFIKLALRNGADIAPMYFFGNTTVLSVLQNKILETISRKYQVSLTLFWGRWGLPLPRPHKLLYVRGKLLGLPHILEPTDEDVDTWHKKYVEEVVRIFETYKVQHPLYASKTLRIE